jgi:hypothetical protein
LKVLMPPALFLLGTGVLKVVYDVVTDPVYIRNNTIMLLMTGLIVAAMGLLADLIVRSRDS